MRKGWENSTLGESCQIKPPKRAARDHLAANDMVSFVPMNCLGVREKHFMTAENRPFQSVSGSYTYFAEGDVLLAKITPCFENGKLGIARGLTNGVGFGSSEFMVFRPREGLDAEYLFYFLSQDSFRDAGANVMSGAVGHKRVPKEFIENFQIPLPPLPEQKRIVAILDDAFSGIDTAIANTEKNLANARELFESYLNSLFSQRGEGWTENPLADFVDFVSTGPFGSLLHKSDYISEGVPLVNPINIAGTRIVPDKRKMIGADKIRELQSYILNRGDVVIARRGEIGRCAVVTERQNGWVCGTGCFFIRPTEVVNPHFLAHLLRSSTYRAELERRASGATMLNLSNKALSNLEISMPCLAEQDRILGQLSELSGQCQAVQSIYKQKLTALAELKQSLLQKAFSGELTAGDVVPITSTKKSSATPATTSPAFAAHIMAVTYHWHESKGKNKTFGHVKAQKTLHLVEALAQIDLGRAPVKDAAGPNDFAHMRTAETWARENDFYEFVQRAEGPRGYDFVKGTRYSEWLSQALDALEPYKSPLDRVVSLLMPLDTQKAELVATAYAAWNNLLLDGHMPSEADIVHEARDNWHRDKQQYTESQFREAITRLRDHGMVPTGTGKRVTGQESLEL